MKAPDFLKVTPEDIGRVGALAACILAAVRYMTAIPGETNGRRIVDSVTWWRASHDDIAQAIGGGVSRRTVSWTVKTLIQTGDLRSVPAEQFYGDRARAYRACEQPLARSDQGSEQPLARSDQPIGKIRPSTSARSDQARRQDPTILPSPEELEEEEPEPPDLPQRETALVPRRPKPTGAEIARTRISNAPIAPSVNARQIAHAYNASLNVPLAAKVLGEVSTVIDECLRSDIPPRAIAAGIEEWTRSDSWSPSQIPKFVHKAANRRRPTNGVGKPTEAALSYQDAAEALLAQMETTP